MNIRTYSLLTALFLVGVLSGCSSHMMDIKYESSYEPEQPNVSEKIYVGEVLDSRGTEPNWLGAIRGGYGNPLKKLYTNDITSKVVEEAFEDALRVRHLLGPASTSQYRIDVKLIKFDTSYYVNKEAHANFTVSLMDKTAGDKVFSRTYKTDNEKSGRAAGIFGDVNSLSSFANDTLNETIDKMLNDQDFIAAIKTPSQINNHGSVAPRLKELKGLKEQGLMSEAEYAKKRESIIDEL
jgi:ABC-type uncharacterized transport system auxiliary subunit